MWYDNCGDWKQPDAVVKVKTMCELLGMSANVPTDICFSFTGLIQRGGRTGPHCDGWGITFYDGKGTQTFRDPSPGCSSKIAGLVASYPIKSEIVISHIRKANRGRVCLENSHPFSRELWGQRWTFAHNGQIKGMKKRRLRRFIPVGTTDSEHAFCWMMERMAERYSTRPAAGPVLWRFIRDLSRELDGSGIFNVLMSDSRVLYAYCSTTLRWITRRAPFGEARLIDAEMEVDFQEVTTEKDVVTVITSRPLTKNENWTTMRPGQFTVFRRGRLVMNDHQSAPG